MQKYSGGVNYVKYDANTSDYNVQTQGRNFIYSFLREFYKVSTTRYLI